MDAKYNPAFRANSKVIEVLVDTNVLRSHICNTNGDTRTSNGGNQDLPIWKLGSLIDYEDNSDSILSGSFYPIAFDLESASEPWLYVTFDITDEELLGVPLQIYGDNDTCQEVMRLQNLPIVFSAVEEVDVRMTISPPWAHRGVPWGLAGNIAWRFSMAESGPLIGLNSSRLEIYAYKPEFDNLLVDGDVPVKFLRH